MRRGDGTRAPGRGAGAGTRARARARGRGDGTSLWVDRWRGDVAAAGRRCPAHDSGRDLLQPPALGLLAAMMVPAERGEAALAGPTAVGVGHGMVQVALRGWPSAPGSGAHGGARPDQVLQPLARLVPRLLVPMVTRIPGQRGDLDRELARAKRAHSRSRPVPGAGAIRGSRPVPWVGAAAGVGEYPGGAATRHGAVAYRLPAVISHRQKPACGRMESRPRTHLPGQSRIDRPESGHVGWFVREPQQCGQRHRQVDPCGQRHGSSGCRGSSG